jgi:phosphate transport system permease protein
MQPDPQPLRRARPPQSGLRKALHLTDRRFRGGLVVVGVLFMLLMLAILATLVLQARQAFEHFGLGFLVSTQWNPVRLEYGALPFIIGTLFTTALALVLAVPVGLGVATFLAFFTPSWAKGALSALVETLAAIPSVVFGLWGLLAVAPWVRTVLEPQLHEVSHGFALFSGPMLGVGVLLAGLVLAAMVLPTIAAVSRDVLLAVPVEQREAALALGATHWQAASRVVIPGARVGILGAVTLGIGRAMGETIAVTMLIGNSLGIATSLFQPGNTIASVIANQFTEATAKYQLSALLGLAVILLVVTALVNGGARLLVSRMTVGQPIMVTRG